MTTIRVESSVDPENFFYLDVKLSNTIKKIKKKIFFKVGIPLDQQRFYIAGKFILSAFFLFLNKLMKTFIDFDLSIKKE